MIAKLKYGNTNTYFIQGTGGGLLVDTDTAGTLPAFYKAIKACGIRVSDITYVLATHYHPDHIGLISELMEQGVKLLLVDTQRPYIHFADEIFRREKREFYKPIDEKDAVVISCGESRIFLDSIGIGGEILSVPSHSSDSIILILDDGMCFAGDLEPIDYLDAYEDNAALAKDWLQIMARHPKTVYFGHGLEKQMS